MRVRRVANVMEQCSELNQLFVVLRKQAWMDLVEVGGQFASQMVGAQRVSESVVRGRREHILAGRELLDGPQPLKFGRVNDAGMGRRYQNVTMNFIANHTVPEVHDGLRSSRFFIALLGRRRNDLRAKA